jgi:hypothetical protein
MTAQDHIEDEAVSATPADAAESLLQAVATLRDEGAQRFDPARLHYIELLAQRMQAATEPLRQVLQGKLQQALAARAERVQQTQQAANDAAATTQATPHIGHAPLAQLNQYIRQATQSDVAGLMPARPVGDHKTKTEMKSVQRFRETWSRISAVDQVDKAIVRGPENAGPLNSHMLVLRSLGLMREISPDYLRRFLGQVETLLWLEGANQPSTRSKARVPGRARPKK